MASRFNLEPPSLALSDLPPVPVTSQSLVCEAGVTTLDQLPQDVFLLICHILLSDSAILPSFRRLMTVPWMDVKSKYIRPLFRLLHVCRSWRTIILEAHALWKYALVDGPDGMPDELNTLLLDRVGDAPVVLSVVFSNETLPVTVQYLEESRALSPNPFGELLHLLSGTPALHYLHLSHPQAYFPLHDPFVGPRVSLPQLQRLTMVWFDWRLCNALLDHLRLPVTVHVNLKDVFLPEDVLLHHPDAMLAWARLPPLPFFPHLARLLFYHSTTGIALAAEGALDPGTTSPTHRPRGRLELTWRIPGQLPFWLRWIRDLPSHIPLASVRTMHLELHAVTNPRFPVLAAVALEELVVFWGSTMCERISLIQLARELGAADPVRCPDLRTLGVRVTVPVPGGGWTAKMVSAAFARVERVLESRAALGHRLDRLLLEIKEEVELDEVEDDKPGAESRWDQRWAEYHLTVSECLRSLEEHVGEVVKTYYNEDKTDGLAGSFRTGQEDWLEDESLAQQRYWMVAKEEVQWDPADV
ncbi:uncharacterized protein BXZ73DRAFT_101343 [Epithele typhae]|uniref:uncharacterized protein n=1 Tax=Epithele typhae TaxID=378194 RepID=UPI0020089CF5|nr:uncharacterized protein BXZ73DRAFT_101343 [Epithele typhae]KAH9932809.1 hypothetical protein BXZ73DRAFT_101343 [Epithele typhae]